MSKEKEIQLLMEALENTEALSEVKAINEKGQLIHPLMEELESIQELRDDLQELDLVTPHEDMEYNFQRFIQTEKAKLKSLPDPSPNRTIAIKPIWIWQAAAAVVLIVAGIFIGQGIERNQLQQAKLAAMAEELEQTKLTMTQLMQQNSTNTRLKAINLTFELDQVDNDIIKNLETLLNNDESTNVRLAAIEALQQLQPQPEAKEVLVRSLERQDKPIVQIALINALVEMEAKEALPVLDDLIEDGDILDKGQG